MAMILFQFPDIPGVTCAFGDRGNNVATNASDGRVFLFGKLAEKGVNAWSECRQVHKDHLLVEPSPTYPAPQAATICEADGLMSSCPGQALMIKTADCQPILLTDSSGAHIMALHAGWRGNRIDFPGTAVRAFCRQYGLRPEHVWAVRGPSLGPGAAEFVNFDAEWGPDFQQWYCPATGKMDLWKLTASQLEAAGVPARQIYSLDICTYANADSWFSWRRDKSEGRQASLIWIRPAGGRAGK